MRGLTWEDVSGGVGLRVTVPVTMGPDEAARELAPRLSALAGERATASSHGESARASHGVPVVTIDGYSGSGKSTLAAALARLVPDWEAGATGETTRVPLAPTIIEGCGAIEAEADLAIWIADPGEDERRSRALARDGQTYAPHWRRWADQDLGRSID